VKVVALLLVATTGFSFGRSGGNIRPLEVRIAPTGRVVVDGVRGPVLSIVQLRALTRLAERVRFRALPARVVCKGVLPDVATRHVVALGRAVFVRGGCSSRFNRLYAALSRAAGVA
jgi:hypothetical protein